MSEPIVIVKYQTEKHYCSCCDQKLQNPVLSKVKEFKFDKERALQWTNWNEAVEYPEDIESMVGDFVYETISFYAADSFVKIIIDDGEIARVKEFILREFVASTTEA